MRKLTIEIWGRVFELGVTYDCYDGEEVLPEQKAALNQFLSQDKLIDTVKGDVEAYCVSHSNGKIDKVDNIFKYVIPTTLYIPRETNKRSVALLCNFFFDPEHDMAIVFENEVLKEIGAQDIVL